MSWRPTAGCERGEAARQRAGQPTQATPGAAGVGRESGPHGAGGGRRRSRGVPVAPLCRPGVASAVLVGQAREQAGVAGEGRGGSAAPLCLHFLRLAIGSSRGPPLGIAAAAAAPPSPLSSPLSRSQRRRRQRWGKADSAPTHTKGSLRSRLAALSTLSSPARSARTSVSWANLVKQAGIYEWKGDQAQRGERCF